MSEAKPSFVLYGDPLSGNAYKTALMLSLTQNPYAGRRVQGASGDKLSPEVLELNPLTADPGCAQIPEQCLSMGRGTAAFSSRFQVTHKIKALRLIFLWAVS